MSLSIPPPASPAPPELASALAAALAAPDRPELWDEAERLADQHQRPEDVAIAYAEAVKAPLDRAYALELCERAYAWVSQWFEDGAGVSTVLTRALEIDPAADWAFRKLSMKLTVDRRWDEVLALYDRVIAATDEPSRRVELYTEAAQIAKDLAGLADRAITYLEALAHLSPRDTQIASSLERLLEREGRYRELVDLWRERIGELDRAAARARRAQIAACLLDRLDSPGEALDEALALLADAESVAAAIGLSERVFAAPSAPAAVRKRALAELRRHYAASGRPEEIIRVLGVALASADPADQAPLHHEIAELLVGQGRPDAALDHYAALLALDPASEEAAERLRDLAEEAGRLDRLADALARAADAADRAPDLHARAIALRFDAAAVREDRLGDAEGAAQLYLHIFQAEGVDATTMLEVTRRLDDLLGRAGRRAERLLAMERRAGLEPGAAERRRLRLQGARLADELGEPDRALASYALVLADDPADREAHEATLALLEREGRWEDLIAALERSAAAPGAGDAARDHRVRAARVYEERLHAVGPAVDAWRQIEAMFGQSEETIDALAALLRSADRWDELAEVIERGLELTLDAARRLDLLQQLGDLHRTRGDDLDRALGCYRAVLAEQPAHEGARAGLRVLLDDARCRGEAVALLLAAFEETGDWAGRLSLLEHRLEAAKDAAARTALLLEAADLDEERARDDGAAIAAIARALPLAPEDTAIEARLLRLGEVTGDWATVARALGAAVEACPPGARAAELHYQRGMVLESRITDLDGALAAYLAALGLAGDRLDAATAAVRTATQQGRWDVAARTLVASARARGACDRELRELMEEEAGSDAIAWDAAAAALTSAVTLDAALPPAEAGELLRTVAVWHRDRRRDPAAAEQALLQAEDRAGPAVDTLQMLAGVQRRAPGRPLVDTLRKLADAGQNVLSALHEAATVAVDVLQDDALSRSILEQLRGEVSARLAAGGDDPTLGELAAFSVRELVHLASAEGQHRRAVEILVEAAALPLGEGDARARLHEAATIAEERIGDAEGAVALYRRILAQAPDDARALARLSAIFAAGDRVADLLALRRHELSLAEAPEQKIALRLSIADLYGRSGETPARIAALRDNLADEPGHPRSLEELSSLLEAEGQHADLATLLEEQAALVEQRGDAVRAADLWTRASEIAEARLGDGARSLADRTRAVAGRPTAETFDALARLCAGRGDHAGAVGWLEKRLAATDRGAAAEWIATVARLAAALGAAGREADARACLEDGLREHPGAEALREPLAALYRAASAWESLVELLTGSSMGLRPAEPGSAPYPGGVQEPRLDRLREAADVCLRRLGSRERAIPILEAMVKLAPADRPARLTLASALRGAGEAERARAILITLLEEYGRRRPPERAEVHFQLAQAAAAAGNAGEAKAQLETAIAMSPEHPGALRTLAGMYRDAGDLGRAERMYGALLLIALRQKAGGEDDPERPARSEVMINLHWILAKMAQQGRSDEMLASAFEAARRSEFEAKRLLSALREAGDHALLLRALEERLARGDLDGPARAIVLSDMADALGGPLGRPEDAFRALLDALELDPGSASLRDRAAAMARRAGAIRRWAEVLAGLADQAEADGKPALAAGLFSSLGEIHERDLGEGAEALPVYLRAERLGAESIPIWRSIDRAAGAAGDREEQIRVLRHLTFAGEAAGDAASQTDDIYRLAELELASPGEVDKGLGSLEWALGREPRYDRAARMLRRAADEGEAASVLAMYERVARASGDPAMLLDALERSARAGTATMDLVREAVDLAAAAGDAGRVEALLRRAVEIGESNTNAISEAVWALVRLAEAREARGEWQEALGYLARAVDAAEHDEAQKLTARGVAIALDRLGSPRTAADVYERLLAKDRHDREVWQPLLDLYRRIGDEDVLSDKLKDAIECAFDASWRIALRMERARLLFERRPDDAASELDEVLQENEENDEAAALLTKLYEKQGRQADLADLMERRLSISRSHDDAASVLELSLRLGELFAQDRPEQAIDVYRSALESAPENKEIMARLLALYAPEEHAEARADILERMVKLDQGRAAAERALALADLRAKLDDEDGRVRALDLGFRADPSFGRLRAELAKTYEEHERWADLAGMLAFEGAAQKGPEGVLRLREAAALYEGKLERHADAAAALGQAAERAPDDLKLLVDLGRSLGRAGDRDAALARVSAAIDRGAGTREERVELLRLRAELLAAPGTEPELDRALADVDAAYRLAPRAVAKDLAAMLGRRRATPGGAADRALLLRQCDLLLDLGEEEGARAALGEWIVRSPNDIVVLTKAAEIEGYGGRWDSAVELCERLVELSQGRDKIAAAMLLAGACAQAGYPNDARPLLEAVHREVPEDAAIRDHLRRIYEQTGAHRELATLHLAEARLVADPADRFAALRRAGTLLLESAGDAAAAIQPLEAARDLRPRDGEVSLLLADAYIKAGRLQEAADFLDAAIQAQKGRRSREVSMMQHRMAQIARAVGDRGNELAWLNAAFESDSQNGEAAAALADVATEFGQLDVAVKALKAITLMKSPKPLSRAMAYLRQAVIAQHQGDPRRAAMLAKKAQQEDPTLEEAGTFLAQLSGA
jgi:tetratricopeptide (TPR) repeat protein